MQPLTAKLSQFGYLAILPCVHAPCKHNSRLEASNFSVSPKAPNSADRNEGRGSNVRFAKNLRELSSIAQRDSSGRGPACVHPAAIRERSKAALSPAPI